MDAVATEVRDVFVWTTVEFLSKHPHQSPDLRARMTKPRLAALAGLTPKEFKTAALEAGGSARSKVAARKLAIRRDFCARERGRIVPGAYGDAESRGVARASARLSRHPSPHSV
ncbi:hypothetical protein SAMN05444158_7096 [Bradyrhizobium canariense]|uniref:Uncharacterized protein n=1 Tax=Bradyrhizobium canariense TaxID=255045 RepID=A0A1H2BEK5_9BRAD|nr:hypothetical protein SAMN05444158_7096 [Bradyrhizobium canariense]